MIVLESMHSCSLTLQVRLIWLEQNSIYSPIEGQIVISNFFLLKKHKL